MLVYVHVVTPGSLNPTAEAAEEPYEILLPRKVRESSLPR